MRKLRRVRLGFGTFKLPFPWCDIQSTIYSCETHFSCLTALAILNTAALMPATFRARTRTRCYILRRIASSPDTTWSSGGIDALRTRKDTQVAARNP